MAAATVRKVAGTVLNTFTASSGTGSSLEAGRPAGVDQIDVRYVDHRGPPHLVFSPDVVDVLATSAF